MELKDKVVLVTGGNTGIGWAISQRFSSEGAQVFVNYFEHFDALEELLANANSGMFPIKAVYGDVTNPDECRQIFEFIANESKGVEILVNNAGAIRKGYLLSTSQAEWNSAIRTNLSSAYYCTRLAVSHMLERSEGRVLNIGSYLGKYSVMKFTSYCTAKAGLIGMTRGFVRELKGTRILINCVAPGLTETRSLHQFKISSNILNQTGLLRVGKTEEIVEAALFLCSHRNSYITGQTLFVDGGGFLA